MNRVLRKLKQNALLRRAASGEPLSPPTTRYERRGNCKRCGACCIEEGCDWLEWRDGKKAFCPIHDKRPERCRNFPAAPPIVYATCGYCFYDQWEDCVLQPKEVL